jgi:hypothetical protein
MFENQAWAERYNISKALFVCKLAEGSPFGPHVIKMVGYIETLDKLGCELKDDLANDMILLSLPVSYVLFIMNIHMNGVYKTMVELHGMLKQSRIALRKTSIMRWWFKRRKRGSIGHLPRVKARKRFLMSPSPDEECFHCHKKGHWFRNCKKYLEEHKKKGSETFALGINVIEINITISSIDSWVFDTRSMIHTCKLLQGLSPTRRSAKDELDVHADNGAKVAATAVSTFHLSLPQAIIYVRTLSLLHVWKKLMVMRL